MRWARRVSNPILPPRMTCDSTSRPSIYQHIRALASTTDHSAAFPVVGKMWARIGSRRWIYSSSARAAPTAQATASS